MEADYLIEIGPEGGNQGGSLLHQGTVDQLQNIHESPTRPYVRV
jgi:excinuclease ABC subunit A